MPGRPPPQIFDRRLIRLRRRRSAPRFAAFDFLHRRAMKDVVDRLETVKRGFPVAVFAGAGALVDELTPASGVGMIVQTDLTAARLGPARPAFVADEEASPLGAGAVDLIVSLLTLHGVNDLVGALAQARAALKPDGLFIAALFGEETLARLRHALYAAEAELVGGASPRIAPFATIQDCGQALARAGFAMPVTDVDKISIRYRSPDGLIRDLRGLGETGALASRPAALRRDAFFRAKTIFESRGDEERFDIVYLTGWAPHESQPKPLRPGAAATSMAAAVKTVE